MLCLRVGEAHIIGQVLESELAAAIVGRRQIETDLVATKAQLAQSREAAGIAEQRLDDARREAGGVIAESFHRSLGSTSVVGCAENSEESNRRSALERDLASLTVEAARCRERADQADRRVAAAGAVQASFSLDTFYSQSLQNLQCWGSAANICYPSDRQCTRRPHSRALQPA